MKKLKTNLDRPYLNSENIESKQNFDKVLSGSIKLKKPTWKKIWFYGAIGASSILLLLTINKSISNSKINPNEKIITSKQLNTLPEDSKCIHTPLENLDEEFQIFRINTSAEQTVKLPSGTEITIPKGSLKANSNIAKIEIREFQNNSSSFIAGIPMDYKNDSFESAGMIEIRGSKDEKNIFIDSTKPIKISMNLTKKNFEFDFWKLNESKRKWEKYPANFKKSESMNPDNLNQKSFNKIKNQLSQTKNKLDEINQNKRLLIEPNPIAFSLPIKENQKFDLDFDTKEFPELEKFKGMEFEVVSEKIYDKSFTKKSWSNVQLIKEDNNYYAIFSSKKDKIKIGVRPILVGKNKESAELEFSKSYNHYEAKKNELETEEKLLVNKKNKQQAEFDRLVQSIKKEYRNDLENKVNAYPTPSLKDNYSADFTITSFGVYNCDKPINYPTPFQKEIIFSFNNQSSPIEIISVFIFDKNKDVRYSYGLTNTHKINDLGCFESDDNTLLTIDREGKLGYILNFNSSKIKNGLIKLNRLDKKDQNIAYLDKLINGNSIQS